MTGAILIGGRSTRFGKDKVLVPYRGRTLVEHVAAVIAPLFDEVILVGHPRQGLEGFRVVEDLLEGYGPLGGIYTALSATGAECCFVCAADMPNLSRSFIEAMISLAGGHDIVMPLWSRGREPLHAIYRNTVVPHARGLLEAGNRRVFSLTERVGTFFVTEDIIRQHGDPELMFSNINTVTDLERMGGG